MCSLTWSYKIRSSFTLKPAVTSKFATNLNKCPRCLSRTRLEGKVAVITGANTGIGKETARELSKRGARVILACRDLNKAQETAVEIQKESGNQVTTLQLDLGCLSSIRTAAEQLRKSEPRIHLLINNAGVMMCPSWKTQDGFEMQLGVNHVGHFLWTHLLLDMVKESAPSRIIVVSSMAHAHGKINFEDLMLEKTYDAHVSYCQSKLANLLFARELACRLAGSGVTVYGLHPGVVKTELGRHLNQSLGSTLTTAFRWASNYFFKTPEMGAQTTLYCALEEKLANESGKYYSDCAEKQPSRRALDDEAARKLWEVSEKLVGLNQTQ